MQLTSGLTIQNIEELVVVAHSHGETDKCGAFSTLRIIVREKCGSEIEVKFFFDAPIPPAYVFALAERMNSVKIDAKPERIVP